MLLTALPYPLRTCKLLTLTILITFLPAYADPVAPDAGQTLRELQQLPDLNPPPAEPQLQIEQQLHIEENIPEPAKEEKKAEDIRFMVKTFHISGNSEIPTSELDALIADLTGSEHNLAELNAATTRITAHYRARGYAVARAYLPAQDIVDGAVAINIVEGRYAQRRIDNRSLLSDHSANDILGRIKDGDVIHTAQVDRTLLLLHDTPGVGDARASLQPGASVGTSDLLVELKPGAAYSGNLSLDNYGNRYIGAYRLGGTLNLNSPFKRGDQINLSALASDQHLAYGRMAYQFPVGGDGLRLGAAYSTTRYRLGKEFITLTAHGKAASSSVFASYPFIRNQTGNLTGLFTLEQKKLTDYVDATSTSTGKHARLTSFGISGNRSDASGNSSFDLSLAQGRLSIDSAADLAIDEATARTNGAFTRLSYSADHLQRLTASDQLFVSLSGQQAGKNLDSSEKFSLGGANGVRAYPQGEGMSDQGYLATLELRHNVSDKLQGTLFYDTGSVTINHTPYIMPAEPNSLKLSGAGVGINADLAGTRIKISLAKRTGGVLPVTIPASAVHSTTLWLQASEQF